MKAKIILRILSSRMFIRGENVMNTNGSRKVNMRLMSRDAYFQRKYSRRHTQGGTILRCLSEVRKKGTDVLSCSNFPTCYSFIVVRPSRKVRDKNILALILYMFVVCCFLFAVCCLLFAKFTTDFLLKKAPRTTFFWPLRRIFKTTAKKPGNVLVT